MPQIDLQFNIADPNTDGGNYSCTESWGDSCDYHWIGTEKGKTCGESLAVEWPKSIPTLEYDIVPASAEMSLDAEFAELLENVDDVTVTS